jgi:hypothetical protein
VSSNFRRGHTARNKMVIVRPEDPIVEHEKPIAEPEKLIAEA